MKWGLHLFLSGALCFLVGCGAGTEAPEAEEPFTGQKNLYGVCYLAWEEVMREGEGLDEAEISALIKNLGAKSVRVWMRANDFMTSPTQLIEENVARMRNILETLGDNGIAVIGMNARSFNRYGDGVSEAPLRTDESFGEYISDYSTMWYTLAAAFPEITYWEIGNEPNNNRAYYYIEDREYRTAPMSFDQAADVFTEELYHASQAIRMANPDAETILGGLTESEGLGLGERSNGEFLQAIYDNIYSGEYPSVYPDDYFDCVAWHPYTWTFDEDYFVEENDKIYDVVLKNEGKDKKVFLTEFGWSDYLKTQEEVAGYVTRIYDVIEKRMPYVQSACIFRLFNDAAERSWIGDDEERGYHMATFGLFADPNAYALWEDYYIDIENGGKKIILTPGAPKPAAYAFQKKAGGVGSLGLLSNGKGKIK